MRRISLLAIMAFGVAALLMVASPSMAVHKGAGALTCGACHTMHNSQGATDLEGTSGVSGGSIILLRAGVTDRSGIHALCLNCHAEDGAQAGVSHKPQNMSAPKVYLSTSYGGGDFSTVGAGGDFSSTVGSSPWALANDDVQANNALGKGHSIGMSGGTAIPPGGDGAITSFSCTNCHDPHGASASSSAAPTYWSSGTVNSFRNLKEKPTGGAAGTATETNGVQLEHVASWVGSSSNAYGGAFKWDGDGDSTGALHWWPVINTAGNLNNVYYGGSSTTGEGIAGISGWCAQCHDNWHEGSAKQASNKSGADWQRHPVNNAIVDTTPNSGAGVAITDWAHYDGMAQSAKLPAAQEQTNTGVAGGFNVAITRTYYADTSDDKVFCLSCHFAHGGPYYDNLRWDYLSIVGTASQTGSAVDSSVGCQICHNK